MNFLVILHISDLNCYENLVEASKRSLHVNSDESVIVSKKRKSDEQNTATGTDDCNSFALRFLEEDYSKIHKLNHNFEEIIVYEKLIAIEKNTQNIVLTSKDAFLIIKNGFIRSSKNNLALMKILINQFFYQRDFLVDVLTEFLREIVLEFDSFIQPNFKSQIIFAISRKDLQEIDRIREKFTQEFSNSILWSNSKYRETLIWESSFEDFLNFVKNDFGLILKYSTSKTNLRFENVDHKHLHFLYFHYIQNYDFLDLFEFLTINITVEDFSTQLINSLNCCAPKLLLINFKSTFKWIIEENSMSFTSEAFLQQTNQFLEYASIQGMCIILFDHYEFLFTINQEIGLIRCKNISTQLKEKDLLKISRFRCFLRDMMNETGYMQFTDRMPIRFKFMKKHLCCTQNEIFQLIYVLISPEKFTNLKILHTTTIFNHEYEVMNSSIFSPCRKKPFRFSYNGALISQSTSFEIYCNELTIVGPRISHGKEFLIFGHVDRLILKVFPFVMGIVKKDFFFLSSRNDVPPDYRSVVENMGNMPFDYSKLYPSILINQFMLQARRICIYLFDFAILESTFDDESTLHFYKNIENGYSLNIHFMNIKIIGKIPFFISVIDFNDCIFEHDINQSAILSFENYFSEGKKIILDFTSIEINFDMVIKAVEISELSFTHIIMSNNTIFLPKIEEFQIAETAGKFHLEEFGEMKLTDRELSEFSYDQDSNMFYMFFIEIYNDFSIHQQNINIKNVEIREGNVLIIGPEYLTLFVLMSNMSILLKIDHDEILYYLELNEESILGIRRFSDGKSHFENVSFDMIPFKLNRSTFENCNLIGNENFYFNKKPSNPFLYKRTV